MFYFKSLFELLFAKVGYFLDFKQGACSYVELLFARHLLSSHSFLERRRDFCSQSVYIHDFCLLEWFSVTVPWGLSHFQSL